MRYDDIQNFKGSELMAYKIGLSDMVLEILNDNYFTDEQKARIRDNYKAIKNRVEYLTEDI